MGKDTIIQSKWKTTEWEKISTKYSSDRGLVSKLYKEL